MLIFYEKQGKNRPPPLFYTELKEKGIFSPIDYRHFEACANYNPESSVGLSFAQTHKPNRLEIFPQGRVTDSFPPPLIPFET